MSDKMSLKTNVVMFLVSFPFTGICTKYVQVNVYKIC